MSTDKHKHNHKKQSTFIAKALATHAETNEINAATAELVRSFKKLGALSGGDRYKLIRTHKNLASARFNIIDNLVKSSVVVEPVTVTSAAALVGALVRAYEAYALVSTKDNINFDVALDKAVLELANATGVDDEFVGEGDSYFYAKLDFVDSVRGELRSRGFGDVDKYVGVIIVFHGGEFSDDVDAAAFNYFTSDTEYTSEWGKAESAGRLEVVDDAEDGDESGEDEDEAEESTVEDEAADSAVIEILDTENPPAPDDEAGSEDDESGYNALYRIHGEFEAKLKAHPGTANYIEGMVGVMYWYGKEDGILSESVTWYSDEEVLNADWREITGE
jgi:hypothetical protein